MAYQLNREENLEEGIQRIAKELVDTAIADIESEEMDPNMKVHEVRKRCKEFRGLVRLVRPAFEDTYKFENVWYRDSARQLTHIRDSHTIINTLEKLLENFSQVIMSDELLPLKEALELRKEEITGNDYLKEKLSAFKQRMILGRERIDYWHLDKNNFFAAQRGSIKTYKRAHKAMNEAYNYPTVESFHEWRKRVKYHWYHTRLLELSRQDVLTDYAEEVHKLSEFLGEEHDLAVLKQILLDENNDLIDNRTLRSLFGIINQRRKELRSEARPIGMRLFSEKTSAMANRFRHYWQD